MKTQARKRNLIENISQRNYSFNFNNVKKRIFWEQKMTKQSKKDECKFFNEENEKFKNHFYSLKRISLSMKLTRTIIFNVD